MKFDTPATQNPIDQLKVVGKPLDRIDGRLKTTGRAPYAYERHDVAPHQAYGYVLGAGIAKGRVIAVDTAAARKMPGILAIVTTLDIPRLEKGEMNTAFLFGGSEIQHYHQAIAVIVAETFEQARDAASLVRVQYTKGEGKFDLERFKDSAPVYKKEIYGNAAASKVGDFESAFANAPVQLDATYRTAY